VPGGIVAVVRAPSAAECLTIVTGLIRAGVPAVEVTMTVPGGLDVLAELAAGDLVRQAGTVLGAGTVLSPQQCQACAEAGARFIVAPVTDISVLAAAHDWGLPYVGGALTPSEVLASMRAGSDAVKLFPIGAMGGVSYLNALREPLPELRAVVSGGVPASAAAGYLAADAHAVCLGSSLIDRAAARAGDVTAVATHAATVLAEIAHAATVPAEIAQAKTALVETEGATSRAEDR
jgi:2-dehydro-3-deoxyphosphogluconate aldolase/(4S)-4-hydroxy-2-oxoglutarate aldolase